ncbi:MAG: isoprenyl transferase [Candidatus Paraimprobicoccus trichonymphae]|uniref:Isoprenyl transferase n=1 Tax=Candidatus Paraimprobicoccus trichonymphae TaxID=3033793 RepID=A0AA48HWF5_9FIRM|nr:MAG: isoprenyl transferase [Candidatus Paraimprobicoccus trichonymphae]
MDGNGRWAEKRNLPRMAGHKFGAETFDIIVNYCNKIKLKYLTLYAFSTENWKRPKPEIRFLTELFKIKMEKVLLNIVNNDIKINFLGDMSKFSEKIKKLTAEIKKLSENKKGLTLNIALNYGSRSEIVNATKNIALDFKNDKIKLEDITENLFSNELYTKNQPELDLIIRTGSEHRLSNFLLWQAAYAEIIVLDVFWPDFKPKNLDCAIEIFSNRNRKFGNILK